MYMCLCIYIYMCIHIPIFGAVVPIFIVVS